MLPSGQQETSEDMPRVHVVCLSLTLAGIACLFGFVSERLFVFVLFCFFLIVAGFFFGFFFVCLVDWLVGWFSFYLIVVVFLFCFFPFYVFRCVKVQERNVESVMY